MARIRRNKVVIGVTGPDRGGFTAWNFTRFALNMAGAEAVHITPSRPVPKSGLDALVIGGGADISPEIYGHSAHHRTVHVDHARDQMEMKLLDELYAKEVPILGICRGAQLVNVFLGGELNQNIHDLDLPYPHKKTPLPNKTVHIESRSFLASIMKCTHTLVNSIHHQAITEPGEGLSIVARDENGITQAIEHTDYPFLLGLQWHPEYMPQHSVQRAIFSALQQAAKSRKE
jgi:putative glutamine amidotransferase